jgi:hypothetical protein
MLRLDFQEVGHPRHHVGLADGLARADGQRVVAVGLGAQMLGHELVTGNPAHRLEHPWVIDPAGRDLVAHHRFPPESVFVLHR